MKELIPLINSNWISINRSKRGPSSHKAYLTTLGKKLVDDRKEDFKILFAIKKLEGYVFSSEKNQYKALRRNTLTKEINSVLRKFGERLENKPNLTSHSFRIGFITQLWRDTGDIEFVRQAIGHSKLESTSSYVENLSDEDRRLRMEKITSPK
jgi:site-specific recombinase XerD